MVNTNYFSGVVKILETPKNYPVDSKTQFTRFRVEVPQKRKNTIVLLFIWGNLGHEVQKFYKRNDYILIEGYTSIRPRQNLSLGRKNSKQVCITVIKVYPILLNSNRTSSIR